MLETAHMNSPASPSATWQSAASERFPELGQAPEAWSTIDLSATFGRILEKAARQDDKDLLRRVVSFILHIDQLSQEDESLVYAVQDILRPTVVAPKLREKFISVLNARTFGQLAGYIEYLTSKQVITEMSAVIGLRKRGA